MDSMIHLFSSRAVTRFSGASILILALIGCGGGGGSDQPPTGNAGFRAAAVGSYQTLNGGSAYPFIALVKSSPQGSALSNVGAGGRAAILAGMMGGKSPYSLGSVIRQQMVSRALTRAGGLAYSPLLDLWQAPDSVSGNITTISYFTDEAGTHSAGSIAITLPGRSTYDTAYASYPATARLDVNVTAGNLPCSGSVQTVYTDAAGANHMQGTITLTRSDAAMDLDLTLDAGMHVGGTVTIHQSGIAIHVTNVSGALNGDLAGNVAVDPYGWTGTGTFNLLTGTMTLNLTVDTKQASASADTAGTMTITNPDGSHDTVNNAINAPPAGSGGGTPNGNNGNNGNNGGNATYNAPVSAFYVTDINSAGHLVGADSSLYGVYASAAGAAPQRLAIPAGATSSTVSGINAADQIVGSSYNNTINQNLGLYWASPSSQPVVLKALPGDDYALPFGINASGQIVGVSRKSTGTPPQRAVYWANSTADPVELPTATHDIAAANKINDNGLIIGTNPSNQRPGYVWHAPAQGATPANAETVVPLSGDTNTSAFALNNKGEIVGYSLGASARAVYWSSPTAQPQALPFLSGDVRAEAFDINDNSVIVGSSVSSVSVYRPLIWKNLTPTDVSTLVPGGTGWTLHRLIVIGSTGIIAGQGRLGTSDTNFVVTPK